MEDEPDAVVIARSWEDPERFGVLFDRHATTLYRYLVRRIGAADAEPLLADVFCAAFESRHRFDAERTSEGSALPWLYGIAAKILGKHRRAESNRLRATARLMADQRPSADPSDEIAAALDAAALWAQVADAVLALPDIEREVLLLHVWEDLPYAQIAAALEIPVGTVRSRLNRTRGRLRRLTDELGPVRGLRPDRTPTGDAVDPAALTGAKERLMQAIDWNRPGAEGILPRVDVLPRLAYRDERAALEYLVRVFGFEEVREARTDLGGHILAFLRVGNGMVMIGRGDAEVHRIHSPSDTGRATVMLQVRVDDIDGHYARAVAAGAEITMELEDAFYGERRYEVTDLEGHRWHFAEPFTAIRARGGDAPEAT